MLLRWVGGKSKLASQIVSVFPPHKRYIEPFFGAGWIFFKKRPAEESIINDKNGDLINLYEVVRDQPQELARLVHYTPKDETTFNTYVDIFWNRKEAYMKLSKPMRAMIFLFLVKNSFNSIMQSFSVISSGWWGDGVLETMWKVHERLKGVNILNRSYSEVLLDFGTANTLAYLDPPYAVTLESNYYQYGFEERDHEFLRDILVAAKYMWVLSYDIHPLVEKLYKGVSDIFMMKTSEVFQSSINKNVRKLGQDRTEEFKQEYLITNFPIQESLPLFQSGEKKPDEPEPERTEPEPATEQQPSQSESVPNDDRTPTMDEILGGSRFDREGKEGTT